ncbi:Uncharacterized membrane protein specific for M.kandleri, MK-26 family [Methanopyrus kandleri AV19]|uniref:Uncharacterized membrane protein specific for M.kandleri, MK-26 family n=1 Tax=Methanopyrus kandleri (strain AV19 / DSM 6324 / JCM 9639 / NBRC 100938) TaxID=190192 RepID=Q8TW76_METKA|nr:Uncharacterized membrane protein specific for M.kandleri, MK-26 family [Methanopyrus kandleri AV19]
MGIRGSRGVVSEFEGSLKREPDRWWFTRFLHEHPMLLSTSLALLTLPPVLTAGRTVWELSDRPHDPAALLVTTSATLAPALAVYSALMAYYTLRARYLIRAPVVTYPHHPAYLPLLYWLPSSRLLTHWGEPKVRLGFVVLYTTVVLLPTLSLLLTWICRVRILWCWRGDIDEGTLARLLERLPRDYTYAPGCVFPALVAISALPGAFGYLLLKGTWSGWYVLAIPASMIVPMTVLTYAVIRKMSRSPVEELTDEWLGEGNAPWRLDLQALAILATFATWTLVDVGGMR